MVPFDYYRVVAIRNFTTIPNSFHIQFALCAEWRLTAESGHSLTTLMSFRLAHRCRVALFLIASRTFVSGIGPLSLNPAISFVNTDRSVVGFHVPLHF